jgi:K+-sensing histidine kinase KdpD
MLPDFRIRQRDYLLEISRALTQELDLDKLLSRILDIATEMLAGQAGLIALRDQRNGWRIRITHGIQSSFINALEPYLQRIPSTTEPQTGELPEINRILTDLTRAATMGMLNGVGLPLITQKNVLGVIFIFRNYPGLFSNNDRVLLSSFANQAAIAVENAQLYDSVTHEKQRLDGLLDSAADGILILSPDLHIERANLTLATILNRPLNEINAQPHNQIIRWAKPPLGLTLDEAVVSGWPLTAHANLYVEGDLERSSGLPTLPVGITYAPLLSPENTLVNIIATVRDITHFRQAEQIKSTFISIVSHELKTPVALIKGYVSTLRREDADWDRAIVDESLAVIEEEADRLSLMIENLLDASRLQAEGFKIKRSDVNLPMLVKRLAERFQTQTNHHTLVVDFPDNFPVVLADETRLQQVLSNLVTNSIKYAPEGEIRISGEVRPNLVIITISDEGPGIAPQDIPHIFDSFYRSPEMAKHTKGTGLGLYLSKSIIEAHGGRMWVDTETGKGARICFSLPRN